MTVSSALIGRSPSSSEEGLCQTDGFKSDGELRTARERERRLSTGADQKNIFFLNFHGLQSGLFASKAARRHERTVEIVSALNESYDVN